LTGILVDTTLMMCYIEQRRRSVPGHRRTGKTSPLAFLNQSVSN
jgi:hypothetical protein